jgi:dihydroorotase
MTTRLTIRKPDDWHLHVRDGAMLKAVMPFTARHFPGLFNAPVAIETYARVFEEEGALDKFEAFASLNGPGIIGCRRTRSGSRSRSRPGPRPRRSRSKGRTRRRWSIATARRSSGR